MTQNISIREFLHDILVNKARSKLSIEQFDSLLGMADQVKKISEKGLLIVTLTQQLQKMSNVNYSSIKRFMNEFLAGLKPQKPRKQRQQVSHRRRRPRPIDRINVPRDINGMAEQSISNPSNLQMVRLGVQAPSQQSSINAGSENISKKSDQNKRDFEFAQQLNKISEGVELITGQQEFQHQQAQQLQEYSKASSSSQSFGVISNLSEKMDLLKHKEKDGEKKTKTARRPAAVQATMTKRKAIRGNLVDENLTLQKTKATLNETIYEQQRPINYEYSSWINEYHEADDLYQKTKDQFLEVTKQKPLSLLSNMMLSAKKNQERRELYEIPTDLTQFDTGYQGETIYDFTSQPMPDFSQNMEASQIQMTSLSIFHYEDVTPTLGEISAKVNKPRPLVFYEMLFKMQKGEIVMSQQNISDFGEIKVQLLI